MSLLLSFSLILTAAYGYFTLWCRRGLESIQVRDKLTAGKPSSVLIVPFRNESHHLPALIHDIQSQHTAFTEVILVNDHSSDDFETVLEDLPSNFKTLDLKEQSGKKAAIALGIEQSSAEIILQTDADCHLPPAWHASILRTFDADTQLVCGAVRMKAFANFWSRFAALDFLSLQATGLGSIGQGKPFMGSAASLAYRRKALEDLDFYGQSKSSGDDVFLLQSLAQKGAVCKALISKQSTVVSYAPEDLKSFLDQRIRWGAKTTSYPSVLAKSVAGLVLGYAVLQLLSIPLAVIYPQIWWLPVLLYLLKLTADIPLLQYFARATGGVHLLSWIIPVSLLYPIYILLVSFLIVVRQPYWKGRKVD